MATQAVAIWLYDRVVAAAEAGETLPPRLPELVSERVARLASGFPGNS